jgi:hypothetical protein
VVAGHAKRRGVFVFWQDEVGNGGVVGLVAVVGAHRWEEIVDIFTAGAAILQSETRYFESSEIQHAWQWARTAKHAEDAPVRIISPATGIWKDYRPEFMGV